MSAAADLERREFPTASVASARRIRMDGGAAVLVSLIDGREFVRTPAGEWLPVFERSGNA